MQTLIHATSVAHNMTNLVLACIARTTSHAGTVQSAGAKRTLCLCVSGAINGLAAILLILVSG
uniref:Putative bacteriophage Lambda NinG protein n=1 Tax=uncultured marine virus TaxID=186617 RepID=A0A0F7L485_9VIRU|nr:putative bacteriophage Lambda NinG protein [uncultured marine virus]